MSKSVYNCEALARSYIQNAFNILILRNHHKKTSIPNPRNSLPKLHHFQSQPRTLKSTCTSISCTRTSYSPLSPPSSSWQITTNHHATDAHPASTLTANPTYSSSRQAQTPDLSTKPPSSASPSSSDKKSTATPYTHGWKSHTALHTTETHACSTSIWPQSA